MNNNRNISRMNYDDTNTNNNYKPFNNNRRNKNKKHSKEQSKVINITHNHYTGPPNNRPQLNLSSDDTKEDMMHGMVGNSYYVDIPQKVKRQAIQLAAYFLQKYDHKKIGLKFLLADEYKNSIKNSYFVSNSLIRINCVLSVCNFR